MRPTIWHWAKNIDLWRCGRKIPKVPQSGFVIGPEAYGASFWAWDGGSPWRIKSYLYALGIPLPEIIDAGQGKAIMEKEDFKKCRTIRTPAL